MAHKRPHSPPPQQQLSSDSSSSQKPEIFYSEQSDYRSSSFIAAFSATLSKRDLQSIPKFKSASHRIAAWRIPSKQKTLTASRAFDLGHDDDGERWAGKKLENLLNKLGVEGVVVVARWFGGVNIGQIRFTMIESAAKDAIYAWKDFGRGGSGGNGEPMTPAAKRVQLDHSAFDDAIGNGVEGSVSAPPLTYKPEEVKALRTKLESELVERDNSISVLRALLDKKRAKLGHGETPSSSPAKQTHTSPVSVLDYTNMTLAKLQMLDKGRDATISYLLKELNKVEEELEKENELDDAFNDFADAHEAMTPQKSARSFDVLGTEEQQDSEDKTSKIATTSKFADRLTGKG